jgi:hypothetical protein
LLLAHRRRRKGKITVQDALERTMPYNNINAIASNDFFCFGQFFKMVIKLENPELSLITLISQVNQSSLFIGLH